MWWATDRVSEGTGSINNLEPKSYENIHLVQAFLREVVDRLCKQPLNARGAELLVQYCDLNNGVWKEFVDQAER